MEVQPGQGSGNCNRPVAVNAYIQTYVTRSYSWRQLLIFIGAAKDYFVSTSRSRALASAYTFRNRRLLILSNGFHCISLTLL